MCDLLRLITVVLMFSQDGDTALHDSASGGHLSCVKFLVREGADITQRNNVSGNCCQVMVMICEHEGCGYAACMYTPYHGQIFQQPSLHK